MKQMKLVFVVLALSSALAAEGSDLKLEIEVNTVGSVLLFITNNGDKPVTVLTSGLARITSHEAKTCIILSPAELVRLKPEKRLLKQSLSKYCPVTLEPGETTYIDNHGISSEGYAQKVESVEIVYEIPENWGQLHGVWHGRLVLSPIRVEKGKMVTE